MPASPLPRLAGMEPYSTGMELTRIGFGSSEGLDGSHPPPPREPPCGREKGAGERCTAGGVGLRPCGWTVSLRWTTVTVRMASRKERVNRPGDWGRLRRPTERRRSSEQVGNSERPSWESWSPGSVSATRSRRWDSSLLYFWGGPYLGLSFGLDRQQRADLDFVRPNQRVRSANPFGLCPFLWSPSKCNPFVSFFFLSDPKKITYT